MVIHCSVNPKQSQPTERLHTINSQKLRCSLWAEMRASKNAPGFQVPFVLQPKKGVESPEQPTSAESTLSFTGSSLQTIMLACSTMHVFFWYRSGPHTTLQCTFRRGLAERTASNSRKSLLCSKDIVRFIPLILLAADFCSRVLRQRRCSQFPVCLPKNC